MRDDLFKSFENHKKQLFAQRARLGIFLAVFGVLLFISFAFISPFKNSLFNSLYSKKTSHAATTMSCISPMQVYVSSDGSTWNSTITLPNGATKYYVETLNNGVPCSTDFEANGSSSPWGAFHSDSNGIARIDMLNPTSGATIANGVYNATFRPCNAQVNTSTGQITCQNTTGAWSNTITVNVQNSATTPNSNLSSYFVENPGYTWIYTNNGNPNSNTRIQIEEETNTCGLTVLPWRFTKNDVSAYWFGGRSDDMRWLLASPGFQFSSASNFNNYFWGYRDKRYPMSYTDIIQSDSTFQNVGGVGGGYVYTAKDNSIPAYNLLPKTIYGQSYIVQEGDYSSYTPADASTCPSFPTLTSQPSSYGSWEIRVEQNSSIPIHNPPSPYDGKPAMRVDYYEAGYPVFTTPNLLRESWYFMQGIGLTEIRQKYFNNYSGGGAPYCISDSDCMSDTIQSPFDDVVLSQYFQNPTLNVSVSADGKNYSSSVMTTPQQGYYLKLDNSYTGYLQAISLSTPTNGSPGKPFKWLWANNGVVYTGSLGSLALGTYTAQFRIWIPDDTFPNETRVSSNTLPWSNTTTVILANSMTTPTPTPLPTPTPISKANVTMHFQNSQGTPIVNTVFFTNNGDSGSSNLCGLASYAPTGNLTTDGSGNITISNVPVGTSYCLRQQIPAQYQFSSVNPSAPCYPSTGKSLADTGNRCSEWQSAQSGGNNYSFTYLTTPPTPTISSPVLSCTLSGGTTQAGTITVSWSSTNPPVQYVDISASSRFNIFWNKAVSTTSTTAPNGFTSYYNGSSWITQQLSFLPGQTYYVRTWNGEVHSSTGNFTMPAACAATSTPRPKKH